MLSSEKDKERIFGGEEEELVSKEENEGNESISDDEKEEKESAHEEEDESISNEGPICRLSHPTYPHTLSRRNGANPPAGCFAGGKTTRFDYENFYYHCTTCDVEFHNACHSRPRKMTHPCHPQHPLIFSVLNSKTGIICDRSFHDFRTDEEFIGVGIPDHGNIFDNCTWCENFLKDYPFFYRCSMCNFCLCPPCSFKFHLPTISNPKSHHHSLIFFPRPLLLPCDACGLVERSDPSYACFQCNYVVHRDCIDLPRVIKITRHPHRLFYTLFLSSKNLSCRLCYKTVDSKYGQYSCNHDDCSYIVHSKCATHKNVWDGRELEWEPEDIVETTEDVASFKKVGDDLIKYFCHEHHLKLGKYDSIRDADKQCEACLLHIDYRDFYNCMQCDFFLHEVCANLPRKLDHALHLHPLFLDATGAKDKSSIICFGCLRPFNGFMYKCSRIDCKDSDRENDKFRVDVGCILVPEFFTHKSHEHPLFIPISAGWEQKNSIRCEGCKLSCVYQYLQCTECEFAICFKCATIPDKLHNKYDTLPLSLCYGEVSDETYWCEVCEEELDPREWFYTCTKPYITIHLSCVFGYTAYMKPNHTFNRGSFSVKVLCNNSNTRPICHGCDNRCTSSIFFKLSNEKAVCSFDCLSDVVEDSKMSKWL